jgi:hypothetical protein
MAKKPRAAAQPKPTGAELQLVEAIATVKRLQDFIAECGGLEKAVATVVGVNTLMEQTGGFAQLKQALEIVGQQPAAAQE